MKDPEVRLLVNYDVAGRAIICFLFLFLNKSDYLIVYIINKKELFITINNVRYKS